MTNDLMLGGVYILMAIMLVLGSLMARREPIAKLVTMAMAWVVIFAAGFVLFTFRDDFGYLAQRLKAEATGSPVTEGKITRIPMAIDGHFWVHAKAIFTSFAAGSRRAISAPSTSIIAIMM